LTNNGEIIETIRPICIKVGIWDLHQTSSGEFNLSTCWLNVTPTLHETHFKSVAFLKSTFVSEQQ